MKYATCATNEAADQWMETNLPPSILLGFKKWRADAVLEKDPGSEALIGGWLSEVVFFPRLDGGVQLGRIYAIIYTWSEESGKPQEISSVFLPVDESGKVNGITLTAPTPIFH